MKRMCVSGVLLLAFALAGCRFVTGDVTDLIPPPPNASPVPASIENLLVQPAQLDAGRSNGVSVSFEFEDLNGDIGPHSAQVVVETRALSGNIRVNNQAVALSATVEAAPASFGQAGTVRFTRTFNVPAAAVGAIELSVRLLDNNGNESNTLRRKIPIVGVNAGGGGVGASAQQCTITNGNRNTATQVRIGRQVFFRVVAPSSNISSQNQDAISFAAHFESGARGDVEHIQWLLETGVNTGVFEGPPAGLTLVSYPSAANDGVLSVLDRDTVIAFYDAPNSFGDICIALAKVF